MPWSALEELVRPLPSARFVVAHAEQGYTANVPIASLRDPLSLLATHADGEPLTPEHGWPLRLVVHGQYFWKSAKWLRGIELTANDRPGFWERYGYHNDADPSRRSGTGSEDTPFRGRCPRAQSSKTYATHPPQYFPLERPSQRPLSFCADGRNPLMRISTAQ